jgi:hypothetical protein
MEIDVDIINPMKKIGLFVIIALLGLVSSQDDADLIKIANIKEFPTGYNKPIRAGYLTITP